MQPQQITAQEAMSTFLQQHDKQLLHNLHAMKEGVDYYLDDTWLSELNSVRRENGISPVTDRLKYPLRRNGSVLCIADAFTLDFGTSQNVAFSAILELTLRLATSVAREHIVVVGAMQYGGICSADETYNDGVIYIDNRRYRLTLF
jgi:hypothetical protein